MYTAKKRAFALVQRDVENKESERLKANIVQVPRDYGEIICGINYNSSTILLLETKIPLFAVINFGN